MSMQVSIKNLVFPETNSRAENLEVDFHKQIIKKMSQASSNMPNHDSQMRNESTSQPKSRVSIICKQQTNDPKRIEPMKQHDTIISIDQPMAESTPKIVDI